MEDQQGRILVVDDNRMNRLKLSLSLEQQGYEVGLAEHGEQALELLRSGDYDVVLLDLIMPEMDGYQVLEVLKKDPVLRDIPVIVISALDELDSLVRCIEMGAEDYLPKSFNPTLLKARLSSSLQKKKLRDLEKKYLHQEVMLRQSEKLALLGKLSAGMAHELNNPAAAAQRGAALLQSTFSSLQQAHLKLQQANLSPEQRQRLSELDQEAMARAARPAYLDALARSDRESEMETWLDEQGVAEAWNIAPSLVGVGYDVASLTALAQQIGGQHFPAVIEWLNCSVVIYSLVEEISQGSARISEIVKALKSYTYMDRAPIQSVDIQEGLDNTLVILRSKLQPGVTVRREYAPDLPKIEAYGSELNQVWTNLIDNAIDAMHGQGEITLRTRHDGEWVVVEVEDNGPGIPLEAQAHVFDPFFTTKEPGKGMGLGLNTTHNIIVQKHKGRLGVTSQPGMTRFEVLLPMRVTEGD